MLELVTQIEQPREAGEGRETGSLFERPERNMPLQTPQFQPGEDCVGLLSYETV